MTERRQHEGNAHGRGQRLDPERAAKVRRTALLAGLFAVLVYLGFILFNALGGPGG